MTQFPTAPKIFLHGIATRVPEHSYTQEFAQDFLLNLQGTTPRKRMLIEKVYANTGIEKRHTVITDYGKNPEEHTFFPKTADLKPEPETWFRNDVFVAESNKIAVLTAENLFEKLPAVQRDRITHLITVSCTGFSVPGFDIHLAKTLGLNRNVYRLHVGFMGCYAALPAMRTARDICLANSDAQVLIVGVELCSIHFQQKFTPEIVVANAIFADGAAAAFVSSNPKLTEGPTLSLDTFATYLVDDSEKEMAWRIGKHGFDMRLSLYVPSVIEMNIKPVILSLLDRAGVSFETVENFAIHPGGRAILDKIREALALSDGALDVSYDVLRQYGNMSSVTILFVLQRILESDAKGRIFTAAFGPGLTVESALLTKDAVG